MSTKDPEEPELEGRRLDGRNLITEWLKNKKENQVEAEYVWNKKQLEEIDTEQIDHLLGEKKIRNILGKSLKFSVYFRVILVLPYGF